MMTTVLLIVSLLLHGVTALWIATLMKRMELANGSKQDTDKLKREIEDLLLSYTEEMKEENNKLANQLKALPVKEYATSFEKEEEEREQQANLSELEQEEELNYEPPLPDDNGVEIDLQQSQTARVLALSDQGLTVEQIAKTLDIGTGEVELMLNFYKRLS